MLSIFGRRLAPTLARRSVRSLCEAAKVESDDTPAHLVAIADQILKLNVLESSQLSTHLKTRLGLDASIPLMMGGGGGAMNPGSNSSSSDEPEEAAVEKTEFDVVLSGFDASSKIKVIKEVRAATGLGLKEAKDVVEKAADAPQKVMVKLSKEEAEEIAKKIAETGAKVEVK